MMKKALCILLCMMLLIPCAQANETADTLQKLFIRQMTAGYGIRGYARLETATGVADWLNYLLPFTASDIQIRAIGEKQATAAAAIGDDEDWQVRFFVKDASDHEVGNTWLYGNPEALYFRSELLPDQIYTIPVENLNLLYQLMRDELSDIFFAFDPFDLLSPGAQGNVSSADAVAELLDVSDEEWENAWLPVLNKYLLHLDLWLSSYGAPVFETSDSGSLTMAGTYTIPAEALKKEAKYLIGQMLFDSELIELIAPLVTMEQRVIYLNPSLVYFYEACIDALPLSGDIVLSREMSAKGEIVSSSISLPIPPLPDKLTAPVSDAIKALLTFEADNLFSGMNRLTLTRSGDNRGLTLSGDLRTLELLATETSPEDDSSDLQGTLRITPAIGVNENCLSAKFTLQHSHNIWRDENFNDHDTVVLSICMEPELSALAQDDPFRSAYVDFAPVSLNWRLNFRHDPYKENSPVQINVDVSAKVPDAEVSGKVVLRITPLLQMEALSTDGAVDVTTLDDAALEALRDTFMNNAVLTMAGLSLPSASTDAAAAE